MGFEEVTRRLREEFGIDCPVIRIADGLYLLHFRGTEDMAHAIGAELGVGVLFSEFSSQPTPEDVRRYFEMGFLVGP